MGTGSFPGVKCGRGVLLTTDPSSTAIMEEYSSTSTHPLGQTGTVTGSLYLYFLLYKKTYQNAQSTISLKTYNNKYASLYPPLKPITGAIQSPMINLIFTSAHTVDGHRETRIVLPLNGAAI
jgi:hypothetical protein